MRVLDFSSPSAQKKSQKSPPSPRWFDALQAVLTGGWEGHRRRQAEGQVVGLLEGLLDNRFVVVRGLSAGEQETPLPPLLVGPPGAFLLAVWPKAGFFRIREDQWEIMQRNTRNYRPAKPNVVQQVKAQAEAAAAVLRDALGRPMPVEPLLIFTAPGADVAVSRPVVHPLLPDGLRRYAAQLAKKEAQFSPAEIYQLLDALRPPEAPPPPPKRRPKPPAEPPPIVRKAERLFDFTPRQWLILGVLTALVLLLFMALILLVLLSQGAGRPV